MGQSTSSVPQTISSFAPTRTPGRPAVPLGPGPAAASTPTAASTAAPVAAGPAAFSGVPVVIGRNQPGMGSAQSAIDSMLKIGSSPIDTAQLDKYLGSRAGITNRAVAAAAANAASAAFGNGAAGTPVQMAAGQAAADVGERLAGQDAQTILDYLSSGRQVNASLLGSGANAALGLGNLGLATDQGIQSGLFGSEAAGLARENQAFNQAIGSAGFENSALGSLMQAGGLSRDLEQRQLDANYGDWASQMDQRDKVFSLLASLMNGTPIASSGGGGVNFDVGQIAGTGAGALSLLK